MNKNQNDYASKKRNYLMPNERRKLKELLPNSRDFLKKQIDSRKKQLRLRN